MADLGLRRELRQPFDVELLREGAYWRTLGLIVSADDDPRHLVIDEVWEPSLIAEWNRGCPDDRRVRAGDLITAVNGQQPSSEQMLDLIHACGKHCSVTLTIR
mmetsp:Transcript_21522/g.41078  ORF Transcript_21522/g.41078 Transcript_21522/m.41078 type:complete len:103 (-) Transcript_21522:94-402(-)|eukprot:CAMPEP_0172672796 /NCGR_PEP_ID=MMETSP1074-20121228/11766_1 /TAXON_ID=2916 /ORGANISM="Ceratium fusus, Strain PA161109" /LENGTH=102 /DNA_ID=CAMNT_0013490027 /DNA_START=93 /DNA_END=401 /DNA_ORIENTATION=+